MANELLAVLCGLVLTTVSIAETAGALPTSLALIIVAIAYVALGRALSHMVRGR